MAQYGLGNFVYEFTVDNGSANFKFHDPEDANNTAEVSVNNKDFPEGITQADSRQVADLAFAQCSKQLNDTRDERLSKEASDKLDKEQEEGHRQREAASEFFNNSADGAVPPAKVEEDGTKVYNTAEPSDSKPKEDKKK